MEINIKDYMSDEEIKAIIEDEIVRETRRTLCNEKEITRILTNISYYELWKKIEQEVPNCQEIIEEKTKEKILEISKFDIFKKRNNFLEYKDSLAQQLLDESVKENKNIIDDKVKKIMNELSLTDIKYDIQSIIEQYIENLFKNKGEKQ
jgi:hypothetical protein